jgi:flavin-dependent dehydrogenase
VSSSVIFDVVIVGGGVAGLTAALHLSKTNCNVCLIEKNEYPIHKVCGEYVSNEVVDYLAYLDIHPFASGAVPITQFELSTKNGNLLNTKLPLGGFGMSRYALDYLLFKKVKDSITTVYDTVTTINATIKEGTVTLQNRKSIRGKVILGAHGKRSIVDKSLQRDFIFKKSQWLGVKAHYEYEFPEDKVALHAFDGGYCGLSKTETGAVNACYLTTYQSFKKIGDISQFQREILSFNPHLKDFFSKAKPIFKEPKVISQISFDKKQPVDHHVFMIGDSAGLIHPLCGNGMAMAIHSAKLFVDAYLELKNSDTFNLITLQNIYTQKWNENFQKRLATGRKIQKLLQSDTLTNNLLILGRIFPFLIPQIIKRTHGNPIAI